MRYSDIQKQILNMKCQKIYKPILILAYLDYIEIFLKSDIKTDSLIALKNLVPFIKHYLSISEIENCNISIDSLDDKNIYTKFIEGPLERIENECFIFTSQDKKFGFRTDNESIDFLKLINTCRDASIELIYNLIGHTISTLDLTTYIEVASEIKTIKIDLKNHPKIYKYLVILSYLDYFEDIDEKGCMFNNPVNADDLVTYYNLYLNEGETGTVVKNKNLKELTLRQVKIQMQRDPLRRLCTTSEIFVCNDKDPKSRRKADLPTEFKIVIAGNFSTEILSQVIRDCCYKMISHHIPSFNTQAISEIRYMDEIEAQSGKSRGRQGQAQYRNSLLERYKSSCAICSADMEGILTASHAKPWRDCSTVHEKLSPNNGLLLCPLHDHLFDRGYITFDINNNYEVIFSQYITESVESQTLNLYDNKIHDHVVANPRMIKYLEYHQNYIFKK